MNDGTGWTEYASQQLKLRAFDQYPMTLFPKRVTQRKPWSASTGCLPCPTLKSCLVRAIMWSVPPCEEVNPTGGR